MDKLVVVGTEVENKKTGEKGTVVSLKCSWKNNTWKNVKYQIKWASGLTTWMLKKNLKILGH